MSTSFLHDLGVYVGRIREFNITDWLVYAAWNGLMVGLLAAECAFLGLGLNGGVSYPAYVWNIPFGTSLFVLAIAVDTIGHRTVYKEFLKRGEALIHHITITSGIASVLALCLAYDHPDFFRIPALTLIVLSVVYSFIDEGMHWFRYFSQQSDRVEMWSHYFILSGHMIMIFAWWHWFTQGYPGVKETLALLP